MISLGFCSVCFRVFKENIIMRLHEKRQVKIHVLEKEGRIRKSYLLASRTWQQTCNHQCSDQCWFSKTQNNEGDNLHVQPYSQALSIGIDNTERLLWTTLKEKQRIDLLSRFSGRALQSQGSSYGLLFVSHSVQLAQHGHRFTTHVSSAGTFMLPR